jgi:alpha-tubulin suppressor-like RCC1 family protein
MTISFFRFPLFTLDSFQIDSSRVFYAGKNIFPFNAKIKSLEGKFQHDISEIPIELEEFLKFEEKFESIRSGDEHFAVLNSQRDKIYGWGFNSHHQLATIDTYKVLSSPDVFFTTEDGEAIKFLECGKLSTCVVTGKLCSFFFGERDDSFCAR